MTTINHKADIEWYQGTTDAGVPFGYLKGWFIAWSLDADGNLTYELDHDPERTSDRDRADDPTRREAERAVEEGLEHFRSQSYSRTLENLTAKCRATA